MSPSHSFGNMLEDEEESSDRLTSQIDLLQKAHNEDRKRPQS